MKRVEGFAVGFIEKDLLFFVESLVGNEFELVRADAVFDIGRKGEMVTFGSVEN